MPTQGRGKRSAEALEIISKLWAEGTVTFKGTYYQYENATLAPQPVQRNLPLWVGGSAPAAIERTARWGTGWQAGLETPEEIAPVITAIKDRTEALGRKIDDDHFGAGFAFRFGAPDDPVAKAQEDALRARLGDQAEAMMAVGDSDLIMERLLAYHAAGAHKFILRPIAKDDEDMMVQTARLIKDLLPRVEALNRAGGPGILRGPWPPRPFGLHDLDGTLDDAYGFAGAGPGPSLSSTFPHPRDSKLEQSSRGLRRSPATRADENGGNHLPWLEGPKPHSAQATRRPRHLQSPGPSAAPSRARLGAARFEASRPRPNAVPLAMAREASEPGFPTATGRLCALPRSSGPHKPVHGGRFSIWCRSAIRLTAFAPRDLLKREASPWP